MKLLFKPLRGYKRTDGPGLMAQSELWVWGQAVWTWGSKDSIKNSHGQVERLKAEMYVINATSLQLFLHTNIKKRLQKTI